MTLFKLSTGVALCALLCACKRPDPIRLQPTIEEAPRLASYIRVADPAVSDQLIRGFHSVEENSWRWTGKTFAVTLAPPPNAAADGAWLLVNVDVPDVLIQKMKSITLSAKVEEAELEPETFTTPGAHQYRRAVPASAFSKDIVNADFTLDKVLPPLAGDGRVLGIVVTSLGLERK